MIRRAFLGGAAMALLAACSQTTEPPAPQKPARPERVIVSPFILLAKPPASDASSPSRVARPVEQEPATQAELRDARALQTALQQALVARLAAGGLPAQAGRPDAAEGRTLLVQGQLVAVDEPAGSRRNAFAAGRAFSAEVQLLYVTGSAAPVFLETLDSTPAPDQPAPTARAATRGRAEIERIAAVLAGKISAYATAQGWTGN